jgi:hypothetical protein
VRRRAAVLGGVALLVAVAAAASYGRLVPRIPEAADDVPVAVFSAPTDVLVPSRPVPHVFVESVTAVAPARAPGDDRVAVYARDDGALLTAVFKRGSDIAGLPSSGMVDGPGGAMVNGHPADVIEDRGDVWVTWRVFFDDDQERDQYGVLGRGLSRSEVLTAARHLVAGDDGPRISRGGLPDGFGPVGAGPASLGANGGGLPGGTTIRWTDGAAGPYVELTAIGVNGPAAAVALAMVGGPGLVPIRTVNGRVGPPAWTRPVGPEMARAWVYGDTAYLVSARGLTDRELDAVVTSLRPSAPEDLAALRAAADDYPLDRLVRAGDSFVAGARFPGGYWLVSVTPGAKPLENLTVRMPGAGGELSTGSGGPGSSGPLALNLNGAADGSAVVVGRMEWPAATYVVEVDGVVQPDGPAAVRGTDGALWFGVVVPPGRLTVIARDAAGVELARESR